MLSVPKQLKPNLGYILQMTLRTTILAVIFVFVAGMICSVFAKPRGLPRQIVVRVMSNVCSSGCTNEQRAEYRRNIRFELHDLNDDKIPEFFVYVDHSDWCGNHFNCDYSVFQRRRNGYRLIASGYPALRITKTLTRGYRNLESRHTTGVCLLSESVEGRDFVAVLRYNGTEYKAIELGERCLDRSSDGHVAGPRSSRRR